MLSRKLVLCSSEALPGFCSAVPQIFPLFLSLLSENIKKSIMLLLGVVKGDQIQYDFLKMIINHFITKKFLYVSQKLGDLVIARLWNIS